MSDNSDLPLRKLLRKRKTLILKEPLIAKFKPKLKLQPKEIKDISQIAKEKEWIIKRVSELSHELTTTDCEPCKEQIKGKIEGYQRILEEE